MAIEAFIGRPGSGKTYTLTDRVLREADRGKTVFANYTIAHPNVYTFGPTDLLDLPPGIVVIDEAHLWFSARQALRLPPSWLQKMSQTRKAGWNLLWCSQHESRVDKVLRDVTDWMWLCSAWLKVDGHPLLFTAQSFEPEYFRRKGKGWTRTVRPFSYRVAQAYDTYENLTVAAHAQRSDDVYAKAQKAQAASSGLVLA